MWLQVLRDTLTHEILATVPPGETPSRAAEEA
jgi:sarcosine oxidase delta subunit